MGKTLIYEGIRILYIFMDYSTKYTTYNEIYNEHR